MEMLCGLVMKLNVTRPAIQKNKILVLTKIDIGHEETWQLSLSVAISVYMCSDSKVGTS